MLLLNSAYLVMGLSFLVGFILFLVLEIRQPYRLESESKTDRIITNASIFIINSVAFNLIMGGTILNVIKFTTYRHVGLLNMYAYPAWLRYSAAIVLMDFFLYIWHMLNHLVPELWRYHRVHHSDMNMDVSTATRAHIIELALSMTVRMGLIFFVGLNLMEVVIFECICLFASQFHHSSLDVPEGFEKIFWLLFVPPSMHRIHHSMVIGERDSNYGTIFSVWDRLLGTLVTLVNQKSIEIGLDYYRKPEEFTVGGLLLMPFSRLIK